MEKEQTDSLDKIRNIEVHEAEELVPVEESDVEGVWYQDKHYFDKDGNIKIETRKMVDKGEEFHFYNHLPEGEFKQVVETALANYQDPTRGMSQEMIEEFDKAMKQAVKDMYSEEIHHIDELEKRRKNPHDC
jgi:hypothetical protein